AVHLARLLTVRRNHHHAPTDLLKAAFTNAAGTILTFINGLLDMTELNALTACRGSPMIGLAEQVFKHPVVRGQLFLVTGQTAGVLDQTANRSAIQCFDPG